MAVTIVPMPKVGEMMESGVVLEWIVEPGQAIEIDSPIVTINTDKVDYDVESPVAGTVLRVLAQEGETVAIGEPLCEVETRD